MVEEDDSKLLELRDRICGAIPREDIDSCENSELVDLDVGESLYAVYTKMVGGAGAEFGNDDFHCAFLAAVHEAFGTCAHPNSRAVRMLRAVFECGKSIGFDEGIKSVDEELREKADLPADEFKQWFTEAFTAEPREPAAVEKVSPEIRAAILACDRQGMTANGQVQKD